jgi:hypothetical protein
LTKWAVMAGLDVCKILCQSTGISKIFGRHLTYIFITYFLWYPCDDLCDKFLLSHCVFLGHAIGRIKYTKNRYDVVNMWWKESPMFLMSCDIIFIQLVLLLSLSKTHNSLDKNHITLHIYKFLGHLSRAGDLLLSVFVRRS